MNIRNQLLALKASVNNLIEAYDNNLREEELFANNLLSHFGFLSYKDLIKKNEKGERKGENILALKWTCLFLYAYYKKSFSEIGFMFNRDHATILKHCHDMLGLIQLGRDKEVMREYHELIMIMANAGYDMSKVKRFIIQWDKDDHTSNRTDNLSAIRKSLQLAEG